MRRNFKSYITNNLGIKLLSLGMALVLWFALIPEEKTYQERTLTVPLEIHNPPYDLIMVENPPQYVDVTIRATQRLMTQISSLNVHAVLDLRQATVAQTSYTLGRNMVSLPQGAEVREISPSQVNLKLEKSREILAQVEARFIGNTPEGYSLEQFEVQPPEVLIRGPESKIKENLKVVTEPIDISTLTQTIEIEKNLILPDPSLRLSYPETTVLVRLRISKIEQDDSADDTTEIR